MEGAREEKQIYNVLFDLNFPKSDISKNLLVEMSFTFFHWKVAEALLDPGNPFEIKNMSVDEVQALALNIFPQGKTVNHFIFKDMKSIRDLYRMSKKKDVMDRIPLEIPFIKDFKGESPMHLCLKANNF